MHLKYYGTGALEGIPAMFCSCQVCQTARRLGGKNIRSRSQAMVDGKLLIDLPPDTWLHSAYGGLNMPNITDCLVTHAHSDHLYPGDFECRLPGFAHSGPEKQPLRPMRIYATATALEVAERQVDILGFSKNYTIALQPIEPFVPFPIEDFTVTPVTAAHTARTGPVCYIIRRGGKTMFYGNDTGYFPEETWDYFTHTRPRFDYVSLDCTMGVTPGEHRRHMNLPIAAKVRKRLLDIGCAGPGTIFCANHFSHNGGLNYEDLKAAAKEHSFLVSYDGMEAAF